MIRLTFMVNREVMNFHIEGKIIRYVDRKWKDWIQCIPYDTELRKKIMLSRNKFPNTLLQFFNLSEAEIREYENAKDDNELAEIIIKDAKSKGCRLLKRENA